MGQPIAKQNDKVVATDTHYVIIPGSPPTTAALPHPFNGVIAAQLSTNVKVQGLPAATVGSVADNVPPHVPTDPGTSFVTPPANRGSITRGSRTVLINGKRTARNGDAVDTCNDVPKPDAGRIIAVGTVQAGD